MRYIAQTLANWKTSSYRLPLLIRGARQVGKSHAIRTFGREAFRYYIEINFELEPIYRDFFTDMEPATILQKIALKLDVPIIPGETLIFLDEIQDCPAAIMALRYFKEKMPELHIIGAGSLLEFALSQENFRMPVGRVEHRYMYPLAFTEWLLMLGKKNYYNFLQQVTPKQPIDPTIHQELNTLFQQYLITGGMPEVVAQFAKSHDMTVCSQIQTNLLSTYRQDFGKYAKHHQHVHLEKLFLKAPGTIGQIFKYSKINADVRSRELKSALTLLIKANILTPVYHTAGTGLPLSSTINYKRFKVNFLDIGLAINACGLTAKLLLTQDFFSLNRGGIMEQVVGQELLAHSNNLKPGELFFWAQDKAVSKAEVDYLMQIDHHIIPIEVKAGTTGRLKSLKIFMQNHQSPIGIRISPKPLALEQGVLSIPFYLVGRAHQLIQDIIYS